MFQFFSQSLGIDLGTANTLVFEKGKGVTLNEPSIVAVRPSNKSVLALGSEAKEMLGKTPGDIMAVRPMQNGVIANFEFTQLMLRYFIHKVINSGFSFLRNPRVVVCVPTSTTEVERHAVEQAARGAGAHEVMLLEEPLASAIGLGVDISQARGRMVIDVGGGTSQSAVISLNGIVNSDYLHLGGVHMDKQIAEYIKEKYNVAIGEATAEYLKIELGSVFQDEAVCERIVRGRSLLNGLPVAITVTQKEISNALKPSVGKILNMVHKTLSQTPPELAGDIYDDGIMMVGGGSMLKGLDRAVAEHVGIPVYRAQDPFTTVAAGAGTVIGNLATPRKLNFNEAASI